MFLTYVHKALLWDLAILLLIACGGLLVYATYHYQKMRALPLWKRRGLAVFGLLVSLTVFYGSFIEPQIITITEREVILPLEEDMTIVVLSDFHIGPYKGQRFMRRLIEKVNRINPDLVLLLGDFIFYGSNPLNGLTPLADLQPRFGTFAVLGNHEYSCYWGNVFTRRSHVGFDNSLRVRRALERSGVIVLRNEWYKVSLGTQEFFVAGLDDMCTRRDDLGKALPPTQRKAAVILLSHDPSVILDNRAFYPHLIVSGHTHDGQIRLPFVGPLSPLPTQLGRNYDYGLFSIDKNTTLAITRGVGESGPRARLFAPPEIMVLRTKRPHPS